MKGLFFILCFAVKHTAFSQKITSANNGIKATVNGQQIEVQFFSPLIVRIQSATVKEGFRECLLTESSI